MKHGFLATAIYFLVNIFYFTQPLTAQTDTQKLTIAILQMDSLFWKGYNTCDTGLCGKFLRAEIAFYHDKGGPTFGKDNLLLSIKNNLCANRATYRLRREAIQETIKVFPLQKNGTTYGAIFSGEHVFYLSQNGQKEQLDGRARFSHLWLLKDGSWKMSYILSYDHRPATSGNN
jgi:hypothetical protein